MERATMSLIKKNKHEHRTTDATTATKQNKFYLLLFCCSIGAKVISPHSAFFILIFEDETH